MDFADVKLYPRMPLHESLGLNVFRPDLSLPDAKRPIRAPRTRKDLLCGRIIPVSQTFPALKKQFPLTRQIFLPAGMFELSNMILSKV